MSRLFSYLIVLQVFFNLSVSAQSDIIPGAWRLDTYSFLIKNKRVAVFANPTSMIGSTHLVDSLISLHINIVKIFGPEHGFRGQSDAGEQVENGMDIKTHIPIISLYGNHKKPTAEDLENVDVILFDIQDVGVRFYTYISSLQYVMEAAIENDKELIILDRPNPNGFYVDGPVLDTAYRSFVGMQPVPVVYGMTICEYALMLMGERWLSEKANKKLDELVAIWEQAFPPVRNVDTYFGNHDSVKQNLKPRISAHIIPCKNYTHKSSYTLPVKPSPNLKSSASILYYPSTCFFEGTLISEGRGTDNPFVIFGHPNLPKTMYSFTPHANEGAKTGKYFGQTCFGWNLSMSDDLNNNKGQLQLQYLLEAYKLFPEKDSFFLANHFFDKLAGTDQLRKQIIEGKTETDIRKTWESDLLQFKAIRKKYLLYPDFNE